MNAPVAGKERPMSSEYEGGQGSGVGGRRQVVSGQAPAEIACSRREFLKAASVASVGAAAFACHSRKSSETARVGIYRASSYQADLVDIIKRSVREHPSVVVKDKVVLLKPNLVEYFDSHK